MTAWRRIAGQFSAAGLVFVCLLAAVPRDTAAALDPPAPGAAPGTPELDALVAAAQDAQKRDTAAWRRYRFRRAVSIEKLDDGGQVVRHQDMEFKLTPAADGFDERLVRIDGRDPTSGEVEEQGRARSFTKHYRTLQAGEDGKDEESAFTLATLLHRSSYRYAGQEFVDGVACHRLDFSPGDPGRGDGIVGKVIEAMGGSLWLTVDGLHLYRARASSIRPVSIAIGLSKVNDVEIIFDAVQVEPGIALPRRVEMVTWARVVFVTLHRRQVFTYTDFTRSDFTDHTPPG
jgi:hypothetical protein